MTESGPFTVYLQVPRPLGATPILKKLVPVWNSGLTQANIRDIKRVQKTAFKVILSTKYTSYQKSLKLLNEKTLEQRRKILCKKFAIKCTKNPKMSILFKKAPNVTRNSKKFLEPMTKSKRAYKGCIPYLTRLLNEK